MTYRHLAAWDHMMGSNRDWCAAMQDLANKTNAPLDAVYRELNADGSFKRWATYAEVQSPQTRHVIDRLLEDAKP